MPLQTGSKAPDFSLRSKTADGIVDVKLSDFAGKVVVLLFFPGAFTGVCTQEMCGVSDGTKLQVPDGVVVLGISVDSVFAQEAWAKQADIQVRLLSDYQHQTTRAYDVELPDLSGMGPSAARAAFVIDTNGVIQYAEQTAAPGELPDFPAILACLTSLT